MRGRQSATVVGKRTCVRTSAAENEHLDYDLPSLMPQRHSRRKPTTVRRPSFCTRTTRDRGVTSNRDFSRSVGVRHRVVVKDQPVNSSLFMRYAVVPTWNLACPPKRAFQVERLASFHARCHNAELILRSEHRIADVLAFSERLRLAACLQSSHRAPADGFQREVAECEVGARRGFRHTDPKLARLGVPRCHAAGNPDLNAGTNDFHSTLNVGSFRLQPTRPWRSRFSVARSGAQRPPITGQE